MKTETGDGAAVAAVEAGVEGGLSVEEAEARLMGGGEAAGDDAGAGEEVETGTGEAGEEAAGAADGDEGDESKGLKEGEEEEEEEEEGEGKLSEKAQKILEREIGKKVAKWHEREEQLLSKIEELERGRATRAPAVASDLMSLSAGELDAEEARIQEILDFCELHPDGYEADPENKNDQNLTAEQIRQAKVKNGRLLREIPRARQVLEQRTASEAKAVEVYPELRRGGADRAVYEQFCRAHPTFRAVPNGLMIIGDMLAAEKARAERAAGKKAGAPPPKARTLPGAGGGAGKKPQVAASGGEQGYTVARMIADGGSVEAATRLMMEREKRK